MILKTVHYIYLGHISTYFIFANSLKELLIKTLKMDFFPYTLDVT